jgi:uncharacterized protein YjbI with pentapeptide repeats
VIEFRRNDDGTLIASGATVQEAIDAAPRSLRGGAVLAGANLARANLSRADLRWANLIGADLRWANLTGANLTRARIDASQLWVLAAALGVEVES